MEETEFREMVGRVYGALHAREAALERSSTIEARMKDIRDELKPMVRGNIRLGECATSSFVVRRSRCYQHVVPRRSGA